MWALVGVIGGGCDAPDPPRVVAQLGCGLDDGSIGTLRVEARGDFPPGGGTQVLLSGGDQTLSWGDLPVDGVTVEGLFGQTVEAVGRTARLRDAGELPVYFAPVDGLCPVEATAGPRHGGAIAVGSQGDVVMVGGRDADGRLLDDVLHLHDEQGVLAPLADGLPFPSTGQGLLALEDRRFLVIGGAGSNRTALDHTVFIDLQDETDPVGEPQTIAVSAEQGPARAYHTAIRRPDGRILVAGGCWRLTPDGECALDADPDEEALPSVLGTSLWIDVEPTTLNYRVGPDLVVPRYGAQMLVARDGVGFLVGGRDEAGMPVHVVERYRPDTTRFRPYGGNLRSEVSDDLPVVGAALQEGGVVLLAMGDGAIHWLSAAEREVYRPWSGWCDGSESCFADLSLSAPALTRGMMTLPGERLLADGVLLPVGGAGQGGADVFDPFVPGPGVATPPPRRVGSLPALLADGSVLLVGGHHPGTGALAEPLALRLRPPLDGPDERIPEVDRAAAGSLVARDPERVELEGETLRLLPTDEVDVFFPRVRAHARGFRSEAFLFEATIHVSSGEAVPHLVLEHGAVEGIAVTLGPQRVMGHERDPQARIFDFSCGPTGLDFSQPQVLRVEVRPQAIEFSQGGETVARCPGPGEGRLWSVGVGASGFGEVLVYDLRLTRL